VGYVSRASPEGTSAGHPRLGSHLENVNRAEAGKAGGKWYDSLYIILVPQVAGYCGN
jgi:hypothetical protein